MRFFNVFYFKKRINITVRKITALKFSAIGNVMTKNLISVFFKKIAENKKRLLDPVGRNYRF